MNLNFTSYRSHKTPPTYLHIYPCDAAETACEIQHKYNSKLFVCRNSPHIYTLFVLRTRLISFHATYSAHQTNRHNLIFVNICNIFWLSKACHKNVDKCRKLFLLILIKIYFEKKGSVLFWGRVAFQNFWKKHNARLIYTQSFFVVLFYIVFNQSEHEMRAVVRRIS